MNKKDKAKLFAAAAAAVGAAAAAAVAVNKAKKKKNEEAMKMLPKGKNIYLIGNSFSAMCAAAYLMSDFGFNGESIHIYGRSPIGGCGSPENGFVSYDRSFMAKDGCGHIFEVLKDVPSMEVGDISVKTEIENFNNAYPLSSDGRLVGKSGVKISIDDRKKLSRLIKSEPKEKESIEDIFSAEFFFTDFYDMWQSILGIDGKTSASEFAKMMREFLFASPNTETCEGMYDKSINSYESIYMTLRKYLDSKGVEFCEDSVVFDMDFDDECKNVTAFHIIDKGTRKIFYMNSGDLCIMTPCTAFEGMTEGTFDSPAPSYGGEVMPLWNKLYEKHGEIGHPGMISEEAMIIFTATFKNDLAVNKIFNKTMNSPGTLMTIKNSGWRMSVSYPLGKYFSEQDDDTTVLIGRIINCGADGNYVKKPAVNAGGSEMLYELLCLLGLEEEWEDIRKTVVNVIPVLMPFGRSAVSENNSSALTEMFPGNGNFAMTGEFVKTEKAKGDLDFYAACAKKAVYGLLGKKPDEKKKKLPSFVDLRLLKRVK